MDIKLSSYGIQIGNCSKIIFFQSWFLSSANSLIIPGTSKLSQVGEFYNNFKAGLQSLTKVIIKRMVLKYEYNPCWKCH